MVILGLMLNNMNKIEGYDKFGTIVERYEDIREFATKFNLSFDTAYNVIKYHNDLHDIRYYPIDAYEIEFKSMENIGPSPSYVHQDPNYFETRNKHMEKLVKEKDALGGKDGGKYSANGSSEHYKKAILEYVDKQERCYGTFLAYALCFMQVDKYRDRAGKKDGVPVEKDIVKANWYYTCSQYLREKIDMTIAMKDIEDFEDIHYSFDTKYGAGRHIYFEAPANLAALFIHEFNLELSHDIKGLGDIVNDLQK